MILYKMIYSINMYTTVSIIMHVYHLSWPHLLILLQDECHLSPGRRPSVGDRDTEQQQQQQLVLGGEHANLSHVSHPLPSGWFRFDF